MAYTNLYNGTWTTSDPLIDLTIAYDRQRSGADMLYRIRVTIGSCTGSHSFGFPIYINCAVNGSTIVSGYELKAASPSQWSSSKVWTSSWVTAANKVNGTTPLLVRVYSGGGSPRNVLYSYAMAVDFNASTLTAPSDVTIGTAASLTITPADPDYEHSISFIANGVEEEIMAQGSSLSASWTPPADWYDEMPTVQTLAGVFRLYCYEDGTLIGWADTAVDLHVPSAAAPTITSVTVSPVNTNAFFTANSLYVAGHTEARVQTAYTLARAATLADISISLAGGLQVGSGDDWTSAIISSVGSVSVSVTVTDSRGMSKTSTTSFTSLSYAKPTLAGLAYARGSYVGGVWTDNAAAGQDLKITFTAGITLSAQGNTGALVTKVDGSTVDTQTLTSDSNTITVYVTSYGDMAGAIAISLTDDVGNEVESAATITGVAVPFNINTHLPGFAFGKMAETAKTVEVANDWDIVKNGVSAFGTSVNLPLAITDGGTGDTGIVDITSEISFTKSSGSSTVSGFGAYRWGKMVQIYITFKASAAISAGTAVFVGTMTGHLPSRITYAASFSNNSGTQTTIMRIAAGGGVRVHQTVNSLSNGTEVTFGFAYLEA